MSKQGVGKNQIQKSTRSRKETLQKSQSGRNYYIPFNNNSVSVVLFLLSKDTYW
jgi:hypothetical protein